ncbi:ABC transporter permease subunit [Nakamurella sp. UYEF19]|uniref:ABC transporter permease n=1 Tax=Nakamurella sp. UYEF19 TaxID=1756392 RepID=UPI003395DAA2
MLSLGTMILLGTLVLWLILRQVFANKWNLPLAKADLTSLHTDLNTFNDWVGNNRNTNPIFVYFFNEIRLVVDNTSTFVTHLISKTDVGLGIPQIGWLGTFCILTFVAFAVSNWKMALLTAVVFFFIGLQGLWPATMDTLSLVFTSVLFALIIGIPLGIWAGTSDRVNKIITPVLDFAQILPSFAYLAPLVLIFLIGPAPAVIATIIFATPPAIRITAHGIRQVPVTTREAVDSLGVRRGQRLRNVLLPMAKRTIVIGINQTVMAALSMVVIASLIGAEGLGLSVSQALQSLDVGTAFNAGLAIVLIAITLDRVTTAASIRAEVAARAGSDRRRLRLIVIGVALVITVVAIYLSRIYLWAAQFPQASLPDLGTSISNGANNVTNWVTTNMSGFTTGFKNDFTNHVLNPFESLLTGSPFFVVGLVLLVIGALVGGWRVAVTVLICLAAMVYLGVWADAMSTLAATIVATIVVMILGLVFGVWMGRSKMADRILRPILDAGQTLPAFVYLVPFLALFQASRLTAIVAAVVYAAPASIKIIADGISQVSTNTIEAATASGSTRWQIITKVQLPMSAKALALATNQGLIYVLSMVVIGGLVGAGALGYDVVSGLAQGDLFGKGLAAGLTLVMMGIILDRITQAAANRSLGSSISPAIARRQSATVGN